MSDDIHDCPGILSRTAAGRLVVLDRRAAFVGEPSVRGDKRGDHTSAVLLYRESEGEQEGVLEPCAHGDARVARRVRCAVGGRIHLRRAAARADGRGRDDNRRVCFVYPNRERRERLLDSRAVRARRAGIGQQKPVQDRKSVV